MMTKKELHDCNPGAHVWVVPCSLWSSTKNSVEETTALDDKGKVINVLFPIPCEVRENFTNAISLYNLINCNGFLASPEHVYLSHKKCLQAMQRLISKR